MAFPKIFLTFFLNFSYDRVLGFLSIFIIKFFLRTFENQELS